MKKNGIGWTCGTYGTEKWCIHGIWRANLKELIHLEKLSVDRTIILKSILKKADWGAWIY
jgi:hypothetical protein